MNAIRSVKNQYLGLNAHLHSYWQSEKGWGGFHTLHIGHLVVALEAILFPMGYTTEIESSLQLRYIDDLGGTPRSDISIFDISSGRSSKPSSTASLSVETLPTIVAYPEFEVSEKPYRAIAIYEREVGQPVAWLELLSPTNKGRDEDARTYQEKRLKLLKNGIVFIELDYLHETPPTFSGIEEYIVRKNRFVHPNAHPYRVAVTDPRPVYSEGAVAVYQFDVDEPMPTASIPLNRGDQVQFDFNQPYQRSFQEMLYGLKLVDYTQLPLNFDRYSHAD